MEVRVKHEVCAASCRPPNGFRVAPPFMANGNAKGHRSGVEDLSSRSWRIDSPFGGIELDFVLEAGGCSVPVENKRSDTPGTVDEALRAKNDRHVILSRGSSDPRPRPFEEPDVRWWHRLARAAIAGDIALRKAHQIRALA